METVLVGEFEKGTMIRSSSGRVIAARCNNGLKEIKVSVSKKLSSLYQYMRPTKTLITKHPTLFDPLEAKNVFVSGSKEVHKEKGLFSKRSFERGDIIAYYSGTLWETTTDDILSNQFPTSNL